MVTKIPGPAQFVATSRLQERNQIQNNSPINLEFDVYNISSVISGALQLKIAFDKACPSNTRHDEISCFIVGDCLELS